MTAARGMTWDLVAAKITKSRKDYGMGEVLDKVGPGPTSDISMS